MLFVRQAKQGYSLSHRTLERVHESHAFFFAPLLLGLGMGRDPRAEQVC